MAACGYYLAKKGIVTPQNKKVGQLRGLADRVGMAAHATPLPNSLHQCSPLQQVLAKISAELTIPALLFTSILACNQDWSTDDCRDVMQAVSSGWILLFLPFWNVGWGMLIGWLGAKISKAPPEFQMSSMVAVAFGNATGLPITLLTVIHSSFGKNTGLGDVDPTLYLSVYLLFNPVRARSTHSNVTRATPAVDVSPAISKRARGLPIPRTHPPAPPLPPRYFPNDRVRRFSNGPSGDTF